MEETFVLLKTKLGQLRGHTKTSTVFNKRYCAFLGIPYGKPPIGDLRFKAPQPFGGWEGVRDALKDGNSPKQPSRMIPGLDPGQVSLGDEDCLYLNVYMNELPETSISKMPVMFFIHGGAFESGSGGFDAYGPDFKMNEDVVLVSINYRCGAFGFLSLENEEVPGNAGLKDQTLALKWVKDNIESFGGDPNNVTIFGISAGGASVHYHLLSQSSRGLFHKAIIQSGFSNNRWALQPEPRKFALKLTKALGCPSENDSEIFMFLQSVSADDIVVASKKTNSTENIMETICLVFTPCVEVAGANRFLTDTPDNLMKTGQFNKVPVILGCAENEGSITEFLGIMDKEKFEYLRKTPELLVPQFLGLKSESNEMKEASDAIWDFYFKEKSLPWEKNIKDFQIFVGDVFFNLGMEQTRRYLLEMSPFPVFSYLFTNHTKCICASMKTMLVKGAGQENNIAKPDSQGTCHGADFQFLSMYRLVPQYEVTPEQKEAIKKHVKAWARFASVGDPNCEELGEVWEKDSKAKPCFMDIGTSWGMRKGIPFADRVEFWNKLITKYCTGKNV